MNNKPICVRHDLRRPVINDTNILCIFDLLNDAIPTARVIYV
jgi:hypothetical protein